jgi:hypothetical protein
MGNIQNDLDAIDPELSKEVTLETNSVEVVKIKIKHLKPIMNFIGPIIPLISESFRIFDEDEASQNLTPGSKDQAQEAHMITLFQTLINDHQDGIMGLVSLLSNMEVKDIEELDLAEFANLVYKIVEYNIDFFTKTVLPKIAAIRLKA